MKKPKKVDLFLVVIILTTSVAVMDYLKSLHHGDPYHGGLFMVALFGFFAYNYWTKGTLR